MTKQELQKIQRLIHSSMIFLDEMQKLHRKETGRDYVISGPLDWPPKDALADVILGGLDRINGRLKQVIEIQSGATWSWTAPPKKSAKEITNETYGIKS